MDSLYKYSCPLCGGVMERVIDIEMKQTHPSESPTIIKKGVGKGYKCVRCGKVWSDTDLGVK